MSWFLVIGLVLVAIKVLALGLQKIPYVNGLASAILVIPLLIPIGFGLIAFHFTRNMIFTAAAVIGVIAIMLVGEIPL